MHEAIRAADAPQPNGHYSQAVRIGNLLFISGQLPISRAGKLVKGSIAEQTSQVLENIRVIVQAAQGTISDIVQCTVYISDIAHWTELDRTYSAFFSGVPVLPARTVVPVKEMHYGAHLEIQALAVLGTLARTTFCR